MKSKLKLDSVGFFSCAESVSELPLMLDLNEETKKTSTADDPGC